MSKKVVLFLCSLGVVVIPVITVLVVMQTRKPGSGPAGAISDEGYRINPSGLKIKDELIGDGEELKDGKTAVVHYTGKLMDGKQFDSSVGKEPFKFQTTGSQVIKGWEEGVVGMKVGGKRKLIVPPDMAYGSRGNAGIPPNSRLYFEIELLKIE